MNALKFEQANIMLAENQDEYETLPIHMNINDDGTPMQTMVADASGNLSMQVSDPYGEATFCMQLSEDEIREFNESGGKLFITQSTFWKGFQPIRMSTINPFTHA